MSKKLLRIDAGIQDLAHLTRLSWRALTQQNEPPDLFRTGGNLSRIEPDDDGGPVLRTLTLYRLRHELARRARFHKVNKHGQRRPAMPPLDVIRDLLATPDPPLPVLNRMVEVPVFNRNGFLHREPGYSESSRLYYAPPQGFQLPEVPRKPSEKDLAQARSEGEWRRLLTASFKQAAGAILIGNLTRPLDSGVLAAALTAPVWTDRILGRSEMARFPVRCIWTTTANNPRVSTELARRSIRIRIDPGCARPWERTDFKHPKLRQWANQHRAELVWASLTLIQAWVAAGQPLWEDEVLGSYEDWSAVMGGILAMNGVEGFLSNMEVSYGLYEPEWVEFVRRWWEKFGDRRVGVGDLFDLAVDSGIEMAGETDHARKVSLGRQLTEHRDQVIGEYRVQRAGEAQRAVLWRLEQK